MFIFFILALIGIYMIFSIHPQNYFRSKVISNHVKSELIPKHTKELNYRYIHIKGESIKVNSVISGKAQKHIHLEDGEAINADSCVESMEVYWSADHWGVRFTGDAKSNFTETLPDSEINKILDAQFSSGLSDLIKQINKNN